MTRKRSNRKSHKKPSRVGLVLVLLFCLAFVIYEFYPKLGKEVEQAKERTEKVIAEKMEQLAEKAGQLEEKAEEIPRKAEKRAGESKRKSRSKGYGEGIEIPAPLKGKPERILKRSNYTTSYNKSTKQPNWVAWELTKEKLIERESRTNQFLPDPDLPDREAITTDEYKRSGYDRGHMCPAGDSKWHWRAMQESFYMTNICPQDHKLNSGSWKELEEDCRRWAEKEGSIYIVCGPIFYNQRHKTIGREHRIPVPDAFFKVVLSTRSNPPKGMGFVFKNKPGKEAWDASVQSIDQVEKLTGMDFFPALPDKVEREVESKVRTF